MHWVRVSLKRVQQSRQCPLVGCWNASSTKLGCPPRLCRLLGYSSECLVGMMFFIYPAHIPTQHSQLLLVNVHAASALTWSASLPLLWEGAVEIITCNSNGGCILLIVVYCNSPACGLFSSWLLHASPSGTRGNPGTKSHPHKIQ